MKRFLLILLSIILITGIIFSGCTKETPTTVKEMKLVSFLPVNAPASIFAKMLGEKIEKYTNGEVKIQLFGPEAMATGDALSAVLSGAFDIVSVSVMALETGYTSGVACLSQAEYSPPELREKGVYKYYQELIEPYGFKFLCEGTPAPAQTGAAFYLKEPISKLSDFQKLQIAEPSGSFNAFITNLGALPVPVDYTDVYTAMERNTIDGYCIGVPGIQDFSLEPVTGCMLDELYGSAGVSMIMKMENWNKLSKKLQDAFTKAAIETEKEGVGVWTDMLEKIRADITAKGVKVVKFSKEDSVNFYKIYSDTMEKKDIERNAEVYAKFEPLIKNPNFSRAK